MRAWVAPVDVSTVDIMPPESEVGKPPKRQKRSSVHLHKSAALASTSSSRPVLWRGTFRKPTLSTWSSSTTWPATHPAICCFVPCWDVWPFPPQLRVVPAVVTALDLLQAEEAALESSSRMASASRAGHRARLRRRGRGRLGQLAPGRCRRGDGSAGNRRLRVAVHPRRQPTDPGRRQRCRGRHACWPMAWWPRAHDSVADGGLAFW